MVSFSKANAKLQRLHNVEQLQPWLQNKRKVYSFDLLSGWTCPQASECLSKVVQIGTKRKIQDGKNCQFSCFSASQEATFPGVYNKRKANFDALRPLQTTEDMARTIDSAMPNNLGVCRIHVAGDFFNQLYFRAWQLVAKWNPDRLFYAYTKSLSWWVQDLHNLPQNFVLTASRGGRQDHLIDEHNLRESRVVFSQAEADELGYAIDHTDEHAAIPSIREQSFALLIHGIQPKGSKASEAIKQLKRDKVEFAYSK